MCCLIDFLAANIFGSDTLKIKHKKNVAVFWMITFIIFLFSSEDFPFLKAFLKKIYFASFW